MPYAIVGGLALVLLGAVLFYSLIKKLIYDSVKSAILDAHSEIQSRIILTSDTSADTNETKGGA
jgi:F0F1-type ATP synthase membrane subunit b/b'